MEEIKASAEMGLSSTTVSRAEARAPGHAKPGFSLITEKCRKEDRERDAQNGGGKFGTKSSDTVKGYDGQVLIQEYWCVKSLIVDRTLHSDCVKNRIDARWKPLSATTINHADAACQKHLL